MFAELFEYLFDRFSVELKLLVFFACVGMLSLIGGTAFVVYQIIEFFWK